MTTTHETAQKLAALNPWQRHSFNATDFSYQSCRFCKRAISPTPHPSGVAGLWKYSVRHYACDECRDKIITEAGLDRISKDGP